MKDLLKADLYRVLKSKLTIVAFVLVVALPLISTLLFRVLYAVSGMEETGLAGLGILFNANSLMSGVYSLSNNVGLVIPIFSAIFICQDISSGTLRNKVIFGKKRSSIYLSHLIVTVLFNVVMISLYAAFTTLFAVIAFPLKKTATLEIDILRWIINGTLTFAFVGTLSTFFATFFRRTGLTIVFSVLVALILPATTSVISLTDFSKIRYFAYFIPTFAGNFLSIGQDLNMQSVASMLWDMTRDPISTVFAFGVASFLLFGALNTVLGLVLFKKRDIK